MSNQNNSQQLNSWYLLCHQHLLHDDMFKLVYYQFNFFNVPFVFLAQSPRRPVQLPVGVVLLHTHHPGEYPHQQRLEVCDCLHCFYYDDNRLTGHIKADNVELYIFSHRPSLYPDVVLDFIVRRHFGRQGCINSVIIYYYLPF